MSEEIRLITTTVSVDDPRLAVELHKLIDDRRRLAEAVVHALDIAASGCTQAALDILREALPGHTPMTDGRTA